jgi:LuxR family transcriptional regulator, quorum-sensing system regulator BjaR1
MEDFGATYLQTRVYRRPSAQLTSENHFSAGGLIARIGPSGWRHGGAAFDYVCFECNPLLTPIRQHRTRYRFSEFAPKGDRAFGPYWDALAEAGLDEALCATSYGRGGTIASLHLGFRNGGPERRTADDLHMAGLLLTERLLAIADPPAPGPPALTARERDVLALVADGKTDWEISVILGIAEATARFHVDNARRKLDAVNRTQAVARLICQGLV